MRRSQLRQHEATADLQSGVVVVAAGVADVDHRGICRDEPDVPILHQPQRRLAEERAVLDAPHAGADGVGGALVAVRVRFDRHASSGGDLDDGAKLVLVEQVVPRVGVRAGRRDRWRWS